MGRSRGGPDREPARERSAGKALDNRRDERTGNVFQLVICLPVDLVGTGNDREARRPRGWIRKTLVPPVTVGTPARSHATESSPLLDVPEPHLPSPLITAWVFSP